MVGDEGADLAVRVLPSRTEEVMEEARDLDVYDDSRSVRRLGEMVEVPVTRPFRGYETVGQNKPVARRVSLDDIVDDPPPYTVVGEVALVDFNACEEERKEEVADALMDLRSIRTVLEDNGVKGEERVPKTRHIAGDRSTETVHQENRFEFVLNPSRVMFSVGNAAERVRMRDAVVDGERVFDAFAGIGYFAVPAALGGAEVVAAEVRREAYDYLVENARRNGVSERIDAHHADCRNIEVSANRVIMGHFEATRDDFLGHALGCVGEEGVLHVHDAVHEASTDETVRAVEATASGGGYDVETDLRRVKGYAEGVAHVVVDARVSRG